MGQLFVNNLTLTLSEDVVTNQPTLSVVSSTGLPTFQVGDWLYLTLTDIREGGELRWEIVKVTSWTGTTLTVVRGQDGTAAQAWLAGAKASLRVTAADMAELEAAVTPAQLLTAIKTVDGAGSGLDADLLDGNDSTYYRQSFNPVVRAGTWSKVALFTNRNLFGSVKVSIHHVRLGVVAGAVLQITFGHSGHGQITQLGSHGHDQIQVRLSASGANDVYLEILDSSSAGDHTYTLYLDDICCDVTPYTTFTDGTSSTSILSLITTANNEIIVDGHKVWHQGNDGSGSGLDADTVDGYHVGTGSTPTSGLLKVGDHLSNGQLLKTIIDTGSEAGVATITINNSTVHVLEVTIQGSWGTSNRSGYAKYRVSNFADSSAPIVEELIPPTNAEGYFTADFKFAATADAGYNTLTKLIFSRPSGASYFVHIDGGSLSSISATLAFDATKTIADVPTVPILQRHAIAGGNNGALTIGTNDASALTLETNNTPRVTVGAGGNVLIGTTTDNGVDKLQVGGSISAINPTHYYEGINNQFRSRLWRVDNINDTTTTRTTAVVTVTGCTNGGTMTVDATDMFAASNVRGTASWLVQWCDAGTLLTVTERAPKTGNTARTLTAIFTEGNIILTYTRPVGGFCLLNTDIKSTGYYPNASGIGLSVVFS